jgi:hypothetical protein
MLRRLTTILASVGLVMVIGLGLPACNGNMNSADNCSLGLSLAANTGVIPNFGWALYDASYVTAGVGEVHYYCQGFTLSYGGIWITFGIYDRDTAIGGDGDYGKLFGPHYNATRDTTLPGTSQYCAGRDVTPTVPGQTCADIGR